MRKDFFSLPCAEIRSRNAAGKNVPYYQKRYSVNNSRNLKMKGDYKWKI